MKKNLKETKIERRSPLTNETNVMYLWIDPKDLVKFATGNCTIQSCFPYLSPDEREFILTGYTKEDWGSMFLEEDSTEID